MNTKFKTLLLAAAGVFLVFAVVIYSKYFTNNTKVEMNDTKVEVKKSNFLIPLEISISCESLEEFKSIGRQLQTIKGVKVSPILFQ